MLNDIFSVLILLPDSCCRGERGFYTRSTMYFPLDVFCVSRRERVCGRVVCRILRFAEARAQTPPRREQP